MKTIEDKKIERHIDLLFKRTYRIKRIRKIRKIKRLLNLKK